MRWLIVVISAVLVPGFVPQRAHGHPGALDENGCHYVTVGKVRKEYHCHQDMPPNPDQGAPVKKSRQNNCHDETSPNYLHLLYFISYPNLSACLKSGGRKPR